MALVVKHIQGLLPDRLDIFADKNGTVLNRSYARILRILPRIFQGSGHDLAT